MEMRPETLCRTQEVEHARFLSWLCYVIIPICCIYIYIHTPLHRLRIERARYRAEFVPRRKARPSLVGCLGVREKRVKFSYSRNHRCRSHGVSACMNHHNMACHSSWNSRYRAAAPACCRPPYDSVN